MKRPKSVGTTVRRSIRRPRLRRAAGDGVARARINALSLNRMLPNMITLLALCAGMTAVRYSLSGRFEPAAVSLIVAGALDGLDGRVARLLKASSSFGAQLDSLSDFICFGVAPALLLYIWTMNAIGGIGWAAALLFGVCSALRLARFNTQLGLPEPPSYAYNFFTGVPAPAAAGLAMLPLYASLEFGLEIFRMPTLCAAWTAIVAGLMVSRVPTFSFKRVQVPAEWVAPLLIAIGVLFAFLLTEPWATMLAVCLVYLGSMPFSIRSYRRLEAAAQELRATRTAPDAPLLRAIEGRPQPIDRAPS